MVENPYFSKKVEDGYIKPIIKIKKDCTERQQTPKAYYPYGVVYLSKVESLRTYNDFYQDRTIPYFIERWQHYEIDDEYDLLVIEAILKKVK